MSTLNTQSAAMLDLLVAESRAAAIGFRQAAATIGDEPLHALLSNFAQLRGQLAGELENALASLDLPAFVPNVGRSASESSSEASYGANPNGAATLAECRENDELILKQYQWILKRELPAQLRQIVSRQHAAMQADCQRLKDLLAAAEPSAAGSDVRQPGCS
jgi:uncharacterized protein (TIGR02284 family)